MNDNEQDELWDLLGKARAPKERPFFAAKVIQKVRESVHEPDSVEAAGFWVVLRRYLLGGLSGVFAVAALTVVVMENFKTPVSNSPAVAVVSKSQSTDPLAPLADAIENTDDLVASLDNLIASQDNSIWLQAAPSSLY